MKVLHVIPYVSLRRGGPSAFILDLCRGLSEAGVDVTLATTDDNGTGHLDVPLSIPIYHDGYTTWYFRRQTRLYYFSWPLTRWLRENVPGYDCVHIHTVFTYPTIPASVLAALNNMPYVVTTHGILMAWGREKRRPWLKRASIQLIERNVLRGAAIVHFTSEQEQNEIPFLAKHLPSVVIPLGIDLKPFLHLPPSGWLRSRYTTLKDRVIILFLSRLDSTKGLDILLNGFQQISRQNINAALVIAGDGEPMFVESLRKEVARLGVGGDVIFTGFLNEEDKVSAMADADVFVLPSWSESFGVAVVEAMACGLPVVISDQVGIHPQVSKAGAGLIVPCEVEPLAQALNRLVVDDNYRRHVGEAASALAKAEFSIEAMTRAMVEIYERIAIPN